MTQTPTRPAAGPGPRFLSLATLAAALAAAAVLIACGPGLPEAGAPVHFVAPAPAIRAQALPTLAADATGDRAAPQLS